jgi:hypothetical protein
LARVFIVTFLSGLLLAALGATFWPLPEHVRFRSLITVQSDGGREEDFLIHWPEDRIARPSEDKSALPPGAAVGVTVLEDSAGQRTSAELFRLRDAEDNVIGVASRLTGTGGAIADPGRSASTWLLVIPSRGALYLKQTDALDATARRVETPAGPVMAVPGQAPGFWTNGPKVRVTAAVPDGTGRVLGGTSEFAGLVGGFTEDWQLEESNADGTSRGRIVLSTLTARGP